MALIFATMVLSVTTALFFVFSYIIDGFKHFQRLGSLFFSIDEPEGIRLKI